LIGSKSETYREFFTETFPGGEFVADQIETLMGPQPTFVSTTSRVDQAVKDARADAETKARAGKATLEQKGAEAKDAVQSAAQQAQRKAAEAKAAATQKAEEAKAAAAKKAADVKSAASNAAAKAESEAKSLKDRVVQVATDAKDKVAETAKAVPFNAGDGLESLVRKAEGAVEKGEKKLASAADAVKEKVEKVEKVDPNAPRVLPDTQRPRELRPETVTPAKPSFEGKEKYTGELPLGFEPPPGYYIPPPPKVEGAKVSDKTMDVKPVLPLLAPKVKDFGTDEPIISQLASTIDSLASSLSAPGGAAAGASGVLTKAQADLTALSTRLSEVKKAEKAKLEKALADKAKEFEATLKHAESSRAQTEQGLQEKWVKEREGMVAEWKNKMETELEGQREGIEKR
jgi:mitofilin